MIDSAKYVILISYLQYIQLNFTLTEVTKKMFVYAVMFIRKRTSELDRIGRSDFGKSEIDAF